MEIEVRAFVEDMEYVKKRLHDLGIQKIDSTQIEDVWFCRKELTDFEQTKMDKVGSFGLRLRLQKDRKPEITVKSIVSDGDHQIFKENETAFEDIGEMRSILSILGFKVFCILKKYRETYGLDNMKVNLEDIEGFRPCVEIEILDDSDFDSNKRKMEKFLYELHIRPEDKIQTSITHLFMRENSFKEVD